MTWTLTLNKAMVGTTCVNNSILYYQDNFFDGNILNKVFIILFIMMYAFFNHTLLGNYGLIVTNCIGIIYAFMEGLKN